MTDFTIAQLNGLIQQNNHLCDSSPRGAQTGRWECGRKVIVQIKLPNQPKNQSQHHLAVENILLFHCCTFILWLSALSSFSFAKTAREFSSQIEFVPLQRRACDSIRVSADGHLPPRWSIEDYNGQLSPPGGLSATGIIPARYPQECHPNVRPYVWVTLQATLAKC